MDGDALGIGLHEHDEVVQIPVQDAGQLQLRKFFKLQPHGAVGEAQLLGDLHQARQRGAAR